MLSSNKIKILYDHQIFESQNYGGISRYFYELIKNISDYEEIKCELSLKFSNNHFLNYDNNFKKNLKKIYSIKNFLPGIQFKGKSKLYDLLTIFGLLKDSTVINKKNSLKKIQKGDFDIFHPTYYDDYFLNFIGDKPFVLTIFDMTLEKMTPQFWQPGNSLSLLKKNLAISAKKIIAISESTKKDLINIFGIESSKINVVYLGNSITCGNEDEDKIKKAFPNFPERYIFYVGKRFIYKNFNFFIKAISDLLKKDKNLYIICAGGNPFNKDENLLFKELGLSEKVFQYDIHDNQISVFYKNAIAFAFPSLAEGFGIPILESFACKCPVVLSNIDSFKEIAGNAALYFDPYNNNSILNSIEKVIYSEDIREDLKLKGEERLKNFSWDQTTCKTKKVYESIL